MNSKSSSMNKLFRKRKLLTICGIIVSSGFLLIFLVHFAYSKYPAKTNKRDANILIIEGWLPAQTLEKAKNEFQQDGYDLLITTGLNFPGNYFQVSMDGYLIFYPGNRFAGNQKDDSHIIEVNVFSDLGGTGSAHFNFFVNKSLIADFTLGKRKKKYGIRWQGKLEAIDSIMIQFDNDRVGEWGDRNLYVKEVIIDHNIVIPYQFNSAYDIGAPDGIDRFLNNFKSNAEITRNELIRMGVDSSKITAVPGEKTYVNRTLRSVLAVRNWLKTSKYNVKGINILSSGPHARRKYMIYDKILGKDTRVGIIYIPDINKHGFIKAIINELREFFGMVYYWIILLFY